MNKWLKQYKMLISVVRGRKVTKSGHVTKLLGDKRFKATNWWLDG